MMAAVVGSSGRPDKAKALFSYGRDGLFLGTAVFTPYAVAPGGQKFYAINQLPRRHAAVTQVNLVLNWIEELKGKGLGR